MTDMVDTEYLPNRPLTEGEFEADGKSTHCITDGTSGNAKRSNGIWILIVSIGDCFRTAPTPGPARTGKLLQ